MAISAAAQTLLNNLNTAIQTTKDIQKSIDDNQAAYDKLFFMLNSCKPLKSGLGYACSFDPNNTTRSVQEYVGWATSAQQYQANIAKLKTDLATANALIAPAQLAYNNQIAADAQAALTPQQKLDIQAAAAKQANYKTILKWGIIIVIIGLAVVAWNAFFRHKSA